VGEWGKYVSVSRERYISVAVFLGLAGGWTLKRDESRAPTEGFGRERVAGRVRGGKITARMIVRF
jgi:hypothetical protein